MPKPKVCPADPDYIRCPWEFDESPTAPKLQKRPTAQDSSDPSLATFRIAGEDHTLGGAIRWALSTNPRVEFGAYSVPHPLKDAVQVRIQMESEKGNAVNTMDEACAQVTDVCQSIREKYLAALNKYKSERGMNIDSNTVVGSAMEAG